ncbi:winged helix-turn-helix transcriptional regulator [Pyrobaculum sp.]|uniref:winged helix-turn-helix transcriptional regulator n=1 Tax=Pyrobaculum sp. TaxID=2004705 RepID=UPI003D0E6A5A
MEERDIISYLSQIFQDELKWCIIRHLMKNGKVTVKDLARLCNTTTKKVLQALNEMEENGAVKITIEQGRQYAQLRIHG